ncbi:hypothetical protein EDD11_002959 [Mortierella claussenii]|nr:hypothetical protein EDD11_002959 [Mortierella claussenii]
MDDIPLEDEPFEPFDNYDDYADEMMQEAERQDQVMRQASSITGATDALPQQTDFLSLFQSQNQRAQEEAERAVQQQREQREQRQQEQRRRPIGSASGGGGDGGDLAAVKVVKKRAKIVKLDHEKLLSEHGLPLLMSHGKRFKIRHKYKDSSEKNANAKNNLADLMRLYQTWAHNLFPKATFRDFIQQAEAKCKSDRQIRSTVDGWRDAYWKQQYEAKMAKEDEERAEQQLQDRQNGVWEDHEHELELAKAASLQDMDHNSSSLQTHSFANGDVGEGSVSLSSSKQNQPKPRPAAASRKGKETAVDSHASSAMRLAVSEDEDDNYEVALNRMRISMNLDQKNDTTGSGSGDRHSRRISAGSSLSPQKPGAFRTNQVQQMDEDHQEEDDEEEEDAPLFTHRALKMMGDTKAGEILGKSIPSMTTVTASTAEREPEANRSTTPPFSPPRSMITTMSAMEGSYDDSEPSSSSRMDPAPMILGYSLSQATLPLLDDYNGSNSTDIHVEGSQHQQQLHGREDEDEDEDEDLMARRKPVKGRRAILLDDSDDE